jgi:undecaprenyl diphosphate synthase
MKKIARLPKHVAFIMDGNGRWAKKRGLPRIEGHRAGIAGTRKVVERLGDYGIRYVTLYSFSTENWKRPREEVSGLLKILEESITKEAAKFHEKGVQIRHLGRHQKLPRQLNKLISEAIELTKNNGKMILNFAFNYGSRFEIVDAARSIAAQGIPPEKIGEKLFSQHLYTANLPDVDLVVRTGGDLRISNFLLWQSAYSEYYFTDVLWPDFNAEELDKALVSYSQRQRRFGKL